MIVAALEARARPLPDGAENCALSMACASSAGVAACEAARLAPCLAACAASATSNAAQKSVAAPAPRAQRPIRNLPSIRTTLNDQKGRECPCRRREGKRLGCAKNAALRDVIRRLSALGHKQTSRRPQAMSALLRKRTSTHARGMSALCHKATYAVRQRKFYSITSSARASSVGGIVMP